MSKVLDLTNQRFGWLVALEQAGFDPQGRAVWLCLCDCGASKIVPSRHLGSGATASCGCQQYIKAADNGRKGADKLRGTRSPLFKDRVGYYALHARIRSSRGPAKNHACVDCGKTARHWSYDLGDEPIIEDGLMFSLDVNRYEPRCVRCHSAHDLEGTDRG